MVETELTENISLNPFEQHGNYDIHEGIFANRYVLRYQPKAALSSFKSL